MAKRFICPKTGKHIKFKSDKAVIGTTNYLSVNAHAGSEHSRRDDMESLGIVMIYFFMGGKLPWVIKPPERVDVDAKDIKAFEKQQAYREARLSWE